MGVATYKVFEEEVVDVERHFLYHSKPDKIRTGHLPHWEKDSKLIFITYHLADSIPQDVRIELEEEDKEWRRTHPEPWDEKTKWLYTKEIRKRLQEALDKGYGDCVLLDDSIRDIVERAFLFFNGDRYKLHSYVIMPNHVHVLAELKEAGTLAKVVHSWKSWTADEVNKALGRQGIVWCREYYDRLIRDLRHYGNVLGYIKKNYQSALWIDEHGGFEGLKK